MATTQDYSPWVLAEQGLREAACQAGRGAVDDVPPRSHKSRGIRKRREQQTTSDHLRWPAPETRVIRAQMERA